MPRRVVALRYADPDAVVVEDVAPREATPGRVVIAVRSAGVNPSDVKTASGLFGDDPAKLPVRLGSEVAGTVTAVGMAEDGRAPTVLRVGDEVLAYPVVGGFADEVLVPARNVLRRPDALDVDAAAGLLLAGVAAWHLVEATGVGAGDRVIVHGASGAVGRIAVQLSLLRGARVLGTASARNQDAVAALGAVPVVYGPGLVDRLRAALPDGQADAALDTAGIDEALDASVALVADRERVATVAGFAHGAELGIRLLGSGPGADPGTDIRNAARGQLVVLAAEGRLRVDVGAAYPLAEARAALDAVARGGGSGKIVLHAAAEDGSRADPRARESG